MTHRASNSLILSQTQYAMLNAICKLSVIPVRATPSEKSEMTTQILFGESCEILDSNKNWALVRTDFDHYEGWCSLNQLVLIDQPSFNDYIIDYQIIVSKTATVLNPSSEQMISFGSNINKLMDIDDQKIEITSGELRSFRSEIKPEQLIDDAFKFIGVPYLWGGRSIFGVDCSGFIQLIFKANGINLPRDAYQQAEKGEIVNFVDEAKPGDLLFFDNEMGQIVHVGLYLGSKNVMHASGFVRIDPVDHFGIYQSDQKNYSHKLRIIKRISL